MLGALGAHAQRADELRIPSDIGLRRDSRLQAHDWGELRLLKALSEVDWKLTLGMAYTHAENGEPRGPRNPQQCERWRDHHEQKVLHHMDRKEVLVTAFVDGRHEREDGRRNPQRKTDGARCR